MAELQNYPVRINSKFRLNPNENNNISYFKITDLININSRKKVYIAVPYANFPGTWYNITSRNNSFTLVEVLAIRMGLIWSGMSTLVGQE